MSEPGGTGVAVAAAVALRSGNQLPDLLLLMAWLAATSNCVGSVDCSDFLTQLGDVHCGSFAAPALLLDSSAVLVLVLDSFAILVLISPPGRPLDGAVTGAEMSVLLLCRAYSRSRGNRGHAPSSSILRVVSRWLPRFHWHPCRTSSCGSQATQSFQSPYRIGHTRMSFSIFKLII